MKRGKSADGATKKEYLANKKKNIEARGKHYDPTQWSEHFDRMDLDKDGVLRPQEQAAYDATKKAGKTATEAASKAQQAPAKRTGQSPGCHCARLSHLELRRAVHGKSCHHSLVQAAR